MALTCDRAAIIVSWNCRGLKQSSKLLCFLKKILNQNQKPTIICLQELKIDVIGKILTETIGYFKLEYAFQPARKASGGLLVLWNNFMEGKLISSDEVSQIITFPERNITVINADRKTQNYPRFCLLLESATEKS